MCTMSVWLISISSGLNLFQWKMRFQSLWYDPSLFITKKKYLHVSVFWFHLFTRAHKVVHSSYGLQHKHPWQSELWAWQGWAKLFQSWGPFLKNMYHTLCLFSKKDLIRWKVSNFALIFYVMSVKMEMLKTLVGAF